MAIPVQRLPNPSQLGHRTALVTHAQAASPLSVAKERGPGGEVLLRDSVTLPDICILAAVSGTGPRARDGRTVRSAAVS